ncbi:MAG: DUF1992 domain-containing protein [Geodermatophilaceae bacterium]|nr:DUF1992 domain-containing protein [Geodermatophilaceae bacterium]
MTERKPAGMSVETWVDKQIREAAERGEFDNLPGAGKPIPGRGSVDDELWWVKQYVAREHLDFALPTSLKLRKEVEDLPARLDRERQEMPARLLVEDLDLRLRAAIRTPPAGPPVALRPLDIDAVLADWRRRRTARQQPAPAPVAESAVRRRWWRRT